jgi:methionyl-tRNA synthetase
VPPFYVTTPIYYVNAVPHLGTSYSTIVADALARFHRARGDETFLLTGLDEHGQKIERMARDKGVEPQAYCDGIAAQFVDAWKRLGIANDDFIRTTSARHLTAVAEMWRRMESAGDIYQAEYDGMYCVGCEDWKSEDDVAVEAGEKICPIHRRPVERVKEQNYFFRLSKYAPELLALYDTPGFIRPESRRNEVASFVRGGLKDFSISRMKKSVSWGIPVPGDPEHVVYVWIDALTNYLTVLGGPEAVARGEGKGALWPQAHHIIAKDILRFHAVYWPAMLMSAKLPQPKSIFCHGYLTVKGQKISKSLPATKVDPLRIADDLGVDALRYFLLREYSFGGDGDFTYESLLQRYESDLGNDLGNLLNRTVSMVRRYLGPELPATPSPPAEQAAALAYLEGVNRGWEAFAPSAALESLWRMVRDFNRLVDESKPWALAKDPSRSADLRQVLTSFCEALRWAALFVAPAMPSASREILRQLGRSEDEGRWPDVWGWPGATLAEPKPIFPRLEPDRQAALIASWVPAEAASATPSPGTGTAPADDITIDHFAKLRLCAARVVAAEPVPKTDKLLKLTLDLGTEQRTVVSGIAGAYTPESLVGRTVVYLANLKPAKIRGVVSQGMILAAGDGAVLALAALDRDVPPGTRIG